jgi:hypothetical protein
MTTTGLACWPSTKAAQLQCYKLHIFNTLGSHTAFDAWGTLQLQSGGFPNMSQHVFIWGGSYHLCRLPATRLTWHTHNLSKFSASLQTHCTGDGCCLS